ncbi:MAG: RNA-metabolising metallo-beta-lactamase [Parcubacteria group bacterium GW2011_GWA1_40_21]|nr:MAG: RNA-metabolising metallo-beta-lactamase [Parcubacteria group bacterium GW2011_GWA1_40_21]
MNTENTIKPMTGNDKVGLSPTSSTMAHRIVPSRASAAHPAHRRPHLPSKVGHGRIADKGRHGHHQGTRRPFPQKKEDDIIPPLDNDTVRILTLGGVEEVGKNMTAIEFRNDIVIVDMGFQFKEESTPGIDYILPNTKYLEERKSKIRAVVITHGHLDHTGGIPYIMDRIGNPPIYTRNLTSILIRKRQTEFPHLPNLDIRVVEKNEIVKLGELAIRFFSVTHTVPDSMGVIIDTPFGPIVIPGDYKLDHIDGIPTEQEEEEYRIFEKEKVLLLMSDSTNIENPGFSTPEKLVHKNLEEIIKNIKGRLIIGTFASQMERMVKIIEIAEKYGKKIVVEGRSMKTNIEIATLAGILNVKKDTIIASQDAGSIPPDRIVVLATGAQGEEFAALMRMATKSHKFLRINERDTVLLSSSIIPGNEKTVRGLKDNLARQGAKIIHYRTSDVYIHSSGHGNRGEIEWLHKKIKSKFFIPIHGWHSMLRLHAELAETIGVPKKNIAIPDNGSIMEIRNKGTEMVKLEQKAPSGLVMVDGFSIGDVQEVVIRDRQMLAQDGMFVIVAIINITTGKLKKSPDIISRGFIYLRESQELLRSARLIIKKTIEDETAGMNPIDFDYLKGIVTDQLSKFLFQKTAKHPIVMPVLIGV